MGFACRLNWKYIILLLVFPMWVNAQTFLVEEPFTSAPTAPAGWTFTGVSNYTSGTMSGKSPNAVKFSSTGNQIVSPNWGGGGDLMSFVLRASTTPNTADVLLVEVYNGTSWSTLASARPRSTARMFVYSISTSIQRARFTYTKNTANVEFDDFTIRRSGACSGTGPYITSIAIDACGSGCEGRDEFFTFFTGSTALTVSNLEFSYPDANNSSVTWCGTSASPCDNYITTNTTEVNNLNALAGCNVFISPGATIPAYAPVIVFNGNGQNTRDNFSSLCSGGQPTTQYYALFANNTTDCNGRFGNYSSTSSCSPECYRGFFIRDRGTGCTDTNYYFKDAMGNADGASVTYSSAGASPTYVMTSCNNFLVLPVSLTSFYGLAEKDQVRLYWQTASENHLKEFVVERSANGSDFRQIGRVSATNTNETHSYAFTDEMPGLINYYYRLNSLDLDGSSQYSQEVFIPLAKRAMQMQVSVWGELVNISVPSEPEEIKRVEIYNASGQKLLSDSYTGSAYSIEKKLLEGQVCFITVCSNTSNYVSKLCLVAKD